MMRKLFVSVLLLLSTAYAAEAYGANGGSSSFAFGYADTQYIANTQAASVLFASGKDWIQAFLGVQNTRGNFDFGLGGMYKFTLSGDRRAGFHLGPGFAVGTVGDDFAFSIYGMVGAHFTLFERLLLSVDGGPMLSVIDGDANFRMRAMGETLGLGIHYLF